MKEEICTHCGKGDTDVYDRYCEPLRMWCYNCRKIFLKQPAPRSSNGRTLDFESSNGGSNPPCGSI